ncbi:MAG TPA: GNAT family N-acetyltransferase [Candidatus Limnocylindrales bacterium]|nr:GNAT family N-acetyltransferase [Candidatus Limnocylindrales bacterium]
MQPPSDSSQSSASGPALDADGLAHFFERLGMRIFRSPSSWWYEAGPRFLLSLPSHRSIHVGDDEIKDLLAQSRTVGVRYVCEEADGGKPSFHLACSDPAYSLEKLSANTRSKVRRGLSRNEIRRITGAELLELGRGAFIETMERQKRASTAALEQWERLLKASDESPAVEVWSAWHEGQFASYLITIRIEDVCEFYQARSRNELLKHYPNNALIYTLTEEMLVRRGVREVTFGLESPEPVEELDAFKLALGYEKKPIRQRVVLHPMLRGALSLPGVRKLLHTIGSRDDANVVWRKASGLVRFAEQDVRNAGGGDAGQGVR